jgi:hypothetical protein
MTTQTDVLYGRIGKRGHFQLAVPTAGSYTLLLQVGEQYVTPGMIEIE